jgi:hypothetical protein
MTSTCEVLGYLLNGEYFYVISVVSFLVVVALLLAALSYEQLLNIAVNTVSRYCCFCAYVCGQHSPPHLVKFLGCSTGCTAMCILCSGL